MNNLNWPNSLVSYQKTPIFNEQNTPDKLQKEHSTKADVWAKIIVKDGSLRYITESTGEVQYLDEVKNGLIFPEQLHHVEITGLVKFYVEFYREPN